MPMAADDAKNFGIYTLDNLPEILAFDHAQVLADYRVFRETGKVTPLRD
jgi:8-oxo-dGTP diphosphatase